MPITKHKVKNLFYIDRDSKIDDVLEKIIASIRKEYPTYIEPHIIKLQDKAGDFRTLDITLNCVNKELDNMRVFFHAAVIPYYYRQHKEDWAEKISNDILADMADEMKRMIGFTLYDTEGRKTSEVNSIGVFKNTKEFNAFLVQIENVCFFDNGYLFPDSTHFNNLLQLKGREAATRQVMDELKSWHDNQFSKDV